MKYISIDSLCDFEFHDSYFILESFDDDLSVKATCLNIHKDAEQNPYDTDMEIAVAYITFMDFRLQSYKSGIAWTKDEKGNNIPVEPEIILSGAEAYDRFTAQLNNGITIFDFDVIEKNTYFIDAIADDPFFTACFTFNSVTIQWDEYKKEAFYI